MLPLAFVVYLSDKETNHLCHTFAHIRLSSGGAKKKEKKTHQRLQRGIIQHVIILSLPPIQHEAADEHIYVCAPVELVECCGLHFRAICAGGGGYFLPQQGGHWQHLNRLPFE